MAGEISRGKRRVKPDGLIGLALAGMLAATAVLAGETVVVNGIHGPEGPLVVDGNLYFVGWNDNRLSKWDGHKTTVIPTLAGCGHNGLALTRRKTFLLACTDDTGAILELSLSGETLRRWDTDDQGGRFVGGINDVVVAPNGDAYATTFGPYDGVSPPGEVIGKVSYLAAGAARSSRSR